jgi:hypothetical protein
MPAEKITVRPEKVLSRKLVRALFCFTLVSDTRRVTPAATRTVPRYFQFCFAKHQSESISKASLTRAKQKTMSGCMDIKNSQYF